MAKITKKIASSFRRLYAEIESQTLLWFRDKMSLFFSILFPIIIILIFGFVFGGAAEQSYQLYYLNEDLNESGQPFEPVNELLTNIESRFENVNLNSVDFNTTEMTPTNWMLENEIRNLIIIPYGWSTNLTNPDPLVNATIQFYYDPTYTSALTILEVVGSVVKEVNSEVLGITIFIGTEFVETPGRENLRIVDFYVPGVIGITISTAGMIGLVNFTKAEKNYGILYKKSSTPLKKWEWSLAKLLVEVIKGLVIAIITVLTAVIAFRFPLTMLHPLMLVVIFFGAMTFGGIGLIFVRLIKNPDAVTAATMSFTFPQMFLAGAIFPLELMPEGLRIVAKFFPLYYISEAMRDLMLDSTINQVWPNLGITIAMGLVFFIIGILISDWRKE
ncbi:MAG: ABC transporter permease [Asgard group archaeon]|nr:ABC transporter permease [Asgard group archaeon]